MVFAYNGTTFDGLQSQPNGNTVQDYIENKLSKLLQRRIIVFPSGRTDKGVHASGAVCHFDLFQNELEKYSCDFLVDFLSRTFPVSDSFPRVRVHQIAPAPSTFDARFSATRKCYCYNVSFNQFVSPFLSGFTWDLNENNRKTFNLDLGLVEKAVEILSGKHNFCWLVVIQENEQREFIRDLKIEVKLVEQMSSPDSFFCPTVERLGKLLQIRFYSDFFLYKMVRRLSGLLVNVGLSKIPLDLVQKIIQTFDSAENITDITKIGTILAQVVEKFEKAKLSDVLFTAPAKGLFLESVEY